MINQLIKSPDLNPDENLGGAIKELVQFPFMDVIVRL